MHIRFVVKHFGVDKAFAILSKGKLNSFCCIHYLENLSSSLISHESSVYRQPQDNGFHWSCSFGEREEQALDRATWFL